MFMCGNSELLKSQHTENVQVGGVSVICGRAAHSEITFPSKHTADAVIKSRIFEGQQRCLVLFSLCKSEAPVPQGKSSFLFKTLHIMWP